MPAPHRPAIASAMDSDLDYLRARLTGSIRSAGAPAAPALPTLTIVDVTDDDDAAGDAHADRMHALTRRRFTIERDGGPWAPYGCAGDVVALVIATTCAVDLVRVARLLDAIPASAPSFAAQFVTRGGATLIVRRTA